ncbi:MAG: hypothetical protein HY858_07925 [Candidatus Solibacter usitatus]|nr:hypothetical protein [Candidatus Solibacter usitatus]
MRFSWLALGLMGMLWLAGCGDLLSVHPLATAETTVFDASLTGEWACADKDCKGTALIRAASVEKKEYDIVWIPGDADEEALRLKGKLVKVGERVVFDLVSTKKQELAVAGHFFMLVEKTSDGVKFHWLDSEWLRNRVAWQNALAHTMVGDKPVITAGSAEMNAFLAKAGLDGKAVSDSLAFRRVKGQ